METISLMIAKSMKKHSDEILASVNETMKAVTANVKVLADKVCALERDVSGIKGSLRNLRAEFMAMDANTDTKLSSVESRFDHLAGSIKDVGKKVQNRISSVEEQLSTM